MRKILLSLAGLVALGVLAGCGTGHHNIPVTTNPTGGNNAGFTTASVAAGTYVFAVHGINIPSGANFAVAGTFTADGKGNITAGTRDTVDDLGRRTLNEAITGSYFVNPDGRGQAILNGSSGRVIYRFVLESATRGKLFQIGTTFSRVVIDAVGDFQLQSGAPGTPVGTYIVRLDGEDPNLNTFGAIGGITFSGMNINGTLDQNDNGTLGTMLVASGAITLSGSRGTATLVVNSFTHHFVVYFVSPTKLVLISSDTNFFLQGTAEAQSSFAANATEFAADAPDQVFSLAGFDTFGPRVEIGRMTLNSAGNLLNAIEDINNFSNNTPSDFAGVNISSSLVVVGANGRWTVNLVNPSGAPTPSLVGWQLSPQRSVLLSTNNNILETGTMRAQTTGLTTADVHGNFAEALSGFNTANPFNTFNFELTANLLFDGVGDFQGVLDSQDDFSGLNLDAATSGTYSIDPATGRSTNGNIDGSSGVNGIPVVYYAVDANTIVFLPSTAGFIYSGTLVGQTP